MSDTNDNYDYYPILSEKFDMLLDTIADVANAALLPKLDPLTNTKMLHIKQEALKQLLDELSAYIAESMNQRWKKLREEREDLLKLQTLEKEREKLIDQANQDLMLAEKKRIEHIIKSSEDYLDKMLKEIFKIKNELKRNLLLCLDSIEKLENIIVDLGDKKIEVNMKDLANYLKEKMLKQIDSKSYQFGQFGNMLSQNISSYFDSILPNLTSEERNKVTNHAFKATTNAFKLNPYYSHLLNCDQKGKDALAIDVNLHSMNQRLHGFINNIDMMRTQRYESNFSKTSYSKIISNLNIGDNPQPSIASEKIHSSLIPSKQEKSKQQLEKNTPSEATMKFLNKENRDNVFVKSFREIKEQQQAYAPPQAFNPNANIEVVQQAHAANQDNMPEASAPYEPPSPYNPAAKPEDDDNHEMEKSDKDHFPKM